MIDQKKSAKSSLSFEALRTALLILVFVFLFLYSSFAIYLKYIGKEAVDNAVHEIRIYNPNITSIEYQHLQFSPLDFLKQQLTLRNVVIHFNNPSVNISLDRLFIQNFMGFVKDPLGDFDIQFNNARVDQFTSVYGLLATWLNNPYLYSEFGNVPNHLNLNLDGELHYQANNNHQMNLALTLKNKNLQLLTYSANVTNLKLTSAFFNSMSAFVNTLNQSTITHIHYSMNIHYLVSLNEIASLNADLAQYLQALGYTNLPLNLQAQSDYNATDTQELYQLHASIDNMGTLDANITYQVMTAPSLADDIAQILGTASNNAPAPNLIVGATLNYQDASLVTRIIQNLAQSTGQSVPATQTFVTTLIMSLAQNLQIPQMVQIAEQVNAFINQTPHTLKIKLNPPQPFSMNEVANFFIMQQQRNQQIQSHVAKLPAAKRSKAYDAYLQQSLAAYNAFFNRLGLSVVANGS